MQIKAHILPLLVLTLLSLACTRLPETGDSVFLLTSAQQENQMGTQGYKEVLSKAKINRDPRLNQILQRVGKRLAAQTLDTGFKWEFTIIESKEQNAWCMPGGKVAVYTGILPIMQNEAAMAAVLGHEIAHATLRHSGQRISQQMAVQMGLSVADLSLNNSKNHDTMMSLLGAGATVGLILPYSRGHESEADLLGLKYMARAGYDPQAAVSFWERFKASSGGAPPEFLSTHPGAATRIGDLKSHMAEAKKLYAKASEPLGMGEAF